MYKQATIMFLYCETPMHAGSGTSLGAIDLPIQREVYTNFPTIAGSGIKGALREWFEVKAEQNNGTKDAEREKITIVFGPATDGSEHAGAVSFTDAKILLFPVRSLKGLFAWITCPTVLARLKRNIELTGNTVEWKTDDINKISNGIVWGTSTNVNKVINQENKKVILEEYTFDFDTNAETEKIAVWISEKVISANPEYKYWKDKINTNLLVLSDDDFSDFVQHSTEVNARIKLGDGKSSDTKHGGNLFYEENLPAETILYSVVLAGIPHKSNSVGIDDPQKVMAYIEEIKEYRVQIGGDETVGKGIVKPNFFNGGNNAGNN